MGNKFGTLIAFAFFLGFTVAFQKASMGQSMTLRGVVIDQNSQRPIPFATVTICTKPMGVVTNEVGEFELYIYEYGLDDLVCISSIGYAQYSFPIHNWGDSSKMISLRAEPYFLEDVFITEKKKGLSASNILKLAFKNLEENYPTEPFKLRGYYRDYQKEQGKYINLLEGAIEVYDPGFHTQDLSESQFRILQLNLDNSFPIDPALLGNYAQDGKQIVGGTIGYSGENEFALLRIHDPIRNYNSKSFSHVYRLTQDFLPNHTFTLLGIQQLNGKGVYEIGFESKKRLRSSRAFPGNRYRATGKIFVLEENYAITDFQYLMEMENEDFAGKMYELKLSYRPFEGQMYINYLSFSNYFEFEETPLEALFHYRVYSVSEELNILELRFSDPVDPATAENPENYTIFKDEIQCPVTEIWLEEDRRVRIQYQDGNAEGNLKIDVHGVRDYQGGEIGKVVFPGLIKKRKTTQFREFFVTEILSDQIQPIEANNLAHKTMSLRKLPVDEDKEFWKTFNRVNLAPLQK